MAVLQLRCAFWVFLAILIQHRRYDVDAFISILSADSRAHRVGFQGAARTPSGARELCMSSQAFNPFSNRNKNTHVAWFEADLVSFYNFVEEQPRLSAVQELQYGKAVAMWSKVQLMRTRLQGKLGKSEPLSDEEMAGYIGCSVVTLEKMCKYADISKSRLVDSNLKLVLAIVSRYRSSAIANSELIAEGTRGLARAAIRYDYTKGFRFATYATWYVHQAVAEYVRWSKHPAKMPSRYTLLRRKIKEFSAEHRTATGSTPTVPQIASALGQSHYDVIKVLSMQSYPALLCAPMQGNTGDRTGGEGRDRTLEDVLPSLYKAPLAQSSSKDLRRDMEEMMQSNLNDVERDVLRLRLGLDDGRVKPIKEVGKRFKISWKQVRSVEKEALTKLLESEQISQFVDSYHSV
jgi:RNA polymerase primary sigma factor